MESPTANLLPHRHRPGTNLMSKLILLDTAVINIITETVFGPNAKDRYSPYPTEWPNGTISDILYLPNSIEANFPPVIIEVQHTVDKDSLMNLVAVGTSAYEQHKKIPPIIITFVISSIKYEVSKKTIRDKKLPFLLRYPCEPWAQTCYFVTDYSLESSSALPLSPFVALSNFLIGQHPSLSVNPFNADLTMQLLYSIAIRIFEDQITKNENCWEDIVQLCQQDETTITKAITALAEDVPDVAMYSRAKKFLDDGKLTSQSFKRKYEAILYSDDSSSLNTTTASNNTNSNNNTNTSTDAIDNNTNIVTTNIDSSSNWAYVEERLSNRNKDVPIPWERIYDDGLALGLFTNYKKWSIMKSKYYRWKKKQN